MYFDKRYLQFNELVFDGFDMISEYDEPMQFKGSSTAYSYGHGSYMPFKSDYLYVSERQVNMTITLKLTKLPCEQRENYARFAMQELMKPGRLWAIRGNEILWAFAKVNNLRPVNSGKRNEVEYDVEFVVPGGVWHKADKQKTFLIPYNICSYMDCKDFSEYNPCSTSGSGCCEPCLDNKAFLRESCECCCENEYTADMMLCNHTSELQQFYSCETPYQLAYDCVQAERLSKHPAFGQRFCVDDKCVGSIIAGQLYSNTDIPTDNLTITIIGDMRNPRIKINDNENVLKGTFNGMLTITSSGDIYYQDDMCCEPTLIEPDVWEIPADMTYGWTIYPHQNKVVIELNDCCGESGKRTCAYIDHEAITV